MGRRRALAGAGLLAAAGLLWWLALSGEVVETRPPPEATRVDTSSEMARQPEANANPPDPEPVVPTATCDHPFIPSAPGTYQRFRLSRRGETADDAVFTHRVEKVQSTEEGMLVSWRFTPSAAETA